ncbi:hypothetical protein KN1_11350 [Stygiolobus caldivivus]|uniref:Uncharacterized protein n=1 Tax=Stygiolobus caldivivus TaxID=2824673 RepID=A0A8D5ZER7_9CREN|nr:hypothetical protein KN1_11350 [Stygiolobus caldivivus]
MNVSPRQERPPYPSCKSNRVVKDDQLEGKHKYKTRGKTSYQATNHKVGKEQKERVLKEYTDWVSMRETAVERKPLTTIHSLIRRKGVEAYAYLLLLQERLEDFTAKTTVLDESWTYVGAKRGRKREDLRVWNTLAGVPSSITGDRGFRAFSYLWDPLPESRVYYTDGHSVYRVRPRSG